MGRKRIMHFGQTYTIQEYDQGEWKDLGELPTLDQAKKLLKELRKLDKI